MDSRIMPFIVLHHKTNGDRFITGYDGDYNKYENFHILGFGNTIKEAQQILTPTKEDRDNSLRTWYAKMVADMEAKGFVMTDEGKGMGLNILLNARD
jgi:hypothetical protein